MIGDSIDLIALRNCLVWHLICGQRSKEGISIKISIKGSEEGGVKGGIIYLPKHRTISSSILTSDEGE